MADVSTRIIDPLESMELRRSVLRPALPVGAEMPGDREPGVVHIGAFDGSTLASACLIFPESCPWQPGRPAWRLRSMATDPNRRGGGFGALVVAEAARVARAESAEILWCHARETALGFYARHGWQSYGEIFDTDIGPHQKMWLDLAGSESDEQ